MTLFIVTKDNKLTEFEFVSSIWNSFLDGEDIIIVNFYDIYDKYHSKIFLYTDIVSMEIFV